MDYEQPDSGETEPGAAETSGSATVQPGPAAVDRSEPAAPSRQGPRWGFVVLAVVVLVGAVAGFFYWFTHRNLLTTDDAFTDGRTLTIAPQVSGLVTALAVNDNQFVQVGQLLVQLDSREFLASRDQARSALLSMQAQMANAQANLAIKQVTQPAVLAGAQARLQSAEAAEIRAGRDYQRFRSVDPAATTRQSVDEASAGEAEAQAQVAQARAEVAQAATVPLQLDQAEAQIHQLDAEIADARAKLAQAELNLGYTRVVAPQSGWVTRRNVEAGNYAQVGSPLFSIVTPDLWITANLKEAALARLRVGQQVRIHVDAFPRLKLVGHVESIQLGSGSKFSAFPAENATGNFVKIVQRVPIKIAIDRGLDPQQPLPLGLSVEPTVDLVSRAR